MLPKKTAYSGVLGNRGKSTRNSLKRIQFSEKKSFIFSITVGTEEKTKHLKNLKYVSSPLPTIRPTLKLITHLVIYKIFTILG